MSKESKTARASAVKATSGPKQTFTTEESIKVVRGNLAAVPVLFIPSHHIAALLVEFDHEVAETTRLTSLVSDAVESRDRAEANNAQLEGMLADTNKELNSILDNRVAAAAPTEPDPSVAQLTQLVDKLAPDFFGIEGESITSAAARLLTVMKENADANDVATRDLMTTVKRQERELAKLGVVLNPNPGVAPAIPSNV